MVEVFSERYKRKVFAEMFSDKVADIVQTLKQPYQRKNSLWRTLHDHPRRSWGS